jgi:hypothetical protein
MDEKEWIALIAAGAALVSSIIAAAVSILTSWKLDRQKSLFDARLAYEYDAKKRLYEQCEPLLFQAFNGLFDAEWQIRGLAKDAARGRFRRGRNHWLREPYYLHSVIYRLFQPIVCLHLLTQKMSQIDLNLDRFIARRIAILHTLQSTLGSEFRMARSPRSPLTYDPYANISDEMRKRQPAVYKNQGFLHGEIDDIVSLMISSPNHSCISWDEFRKKVSKEPALIDVASDLFQDFHPRTSPVLWRILIGYALCVRFALSSRPSLELSDLAKIVVADDVARFDWRTEDEKADSANPDTDDKIMDNIRAAQDVVLRGYEENLRRYGQGSTEIFDNAERDID